jgi:hypothetical protein
MPTPTITFTAPLSITAAAGDGKAPTFTMAAYTGGPLPLSGWSYPVYVDMAGVKGADRSRPILRDHELSRVVGHTTSITITPTGAARGIFAAGSISGAGPDAAEVVAAGKSGFPWQASIGAAPDRTELVAAGNTATVNGESVTGPAYIVRASTLREISVVALGADDGTSTRISAKDRRMPSPSADPAVTTTGTSAADIEAAWMADVAKLCGDKHDAINASALAEGWTTARVKAAVDAAELVELRASRAPIGTIPGSGTQHARGVDSRALLTAAAMLHAGHREAAEKQCGAEVCTRAEGLHVNSWMDLCRAALQLDHRDVPRDRSALITAAFSTESLPVALGDSAHKSLLQSFNNTPSTWRTVGNRRPVTNFKVHNALRSWNSKAALEPVAPDGEISHAALGEQNFTHKAETFAKMVAITRTSIINDDAGLFMDQSAEFGRQATRTIGDTFWRAVLANTGTFFGSGNSNIITGSGTALSTTSFGLAIKKLREMTDADGRPISLAPFCLVTPPALESTARQVLNSTFVQRLVTADQSPTANPWSGAAKLEVEARLASTAIHANASSAEWYLFCDPIITPAVIVSFLNGVENPIVETSNADFNQLGVQMRCVLDFGADLADTRGCVKSAGTA